MEDVVVAGDDGRRILAVDHLEVGRGELVGIRGPSGAGKTTLLYVMAGLLRPARGRVRWDGIDLAALGEAARDGFRRDHMGMIFQDFLLFEELSPLANAAIVAAYSPRGRRSGIRERAASLLARLQVPIDGGRGVNTFSGGERQRVAVSRALAGDPRIILADEPTASLDRATADRLIEDLLRTVRADGRTFIAVSHDPAILAETDRVIDVVDGVARLSLEADAGAVRHA